jgi:hypothetical protein
MQYLACAMLSLDWQRDEDIEYPRQVIGQALD